MLVITNLALAGWILGILLLVRYFLKHHVEKQTHPGVVFNEFLELLEDRVEVLRICISILDFLLQPLFVDSVVLGEPSSSPERCQ